MKYHYENIVSFPGDPLWAEEECGPVLDCVFHVHRECELTLVESSFGCRFIGNSIEPFSEGDLVLAGPMLPHHYLNRKSDSTGDDWSRLVVVKFAPDFCGRELLEKPEAAPIAELLKQSACGLHFSREIARSVREPMRDLLTLHGMRKMLKMLELLEFLSRVPVRRLNAYPAPGTYSELPDERLNRILDFIHRRLDGTRPPGLEETARVACMTPQAFSSYFHRATRRSFIHYITEIRLNRAASLLTRTDKTVLEIAGEAGFNNLSNFNRRFRARRGLSPSEYRKKYRIGS